MARPRMAIVITTINVPRLLEGYAANFERFGHLDEVRALIIGDEHLHRPEPVPCFFLPGVQTIFFASSHRRVSPRCGTTTGILPSNSRRKYASVRIAHCRSRTISHRRSQSHSIAHLLTTISQVRIESRNRVYYVWYIPATLPIAIIWSTG